MEEPTNEYDEDGTREPLPSPLDVLCCQIRIELEKRQPERAIDLILNAPPECFSAEPPKTRMVPAVTAEDVREAIKLKPGRKNKEIAETIGCHVKTVALQRRLLQKMSERRQAAQRGAR
jgi:hypothetical protein